MSILSERVRSQHEYEIAIDLGAFLANYNQVVQKLTEVTNLMTQTVRDDEFLGSPSPVKRSRRKVA